MTFRNRINKPTGLTRGAMMFFLVGMLWPYFFHPATPLWKDVGDGLRGLLFGVSIGVSIFAGLQARRLRRCGGSQTAGL